MSYPQRPHGLQPSRLIRPWDFPGKSTGVGCHCLLRGRLLCNSLLNVSCSSFCLCSLSSHGRPLYSYIADFYFFNHEWVLDLSNTFSASIEIVILFLSFFVNMVYYINCFAYIELSLHCCNKSHLTMVCDSLHMCVCVCVCVCELSCARLFAVP